MPQNAIGFQYLQETRYSRDSLRAEPLTQYPRSPLYKTYPQGTTRLALPPVPEAFRANFWQTIKERRSLRDYVEQAITQEELAGLLWAAQGVTAVQQNFAFRAAPSAGALYPVETYVAVHRVEEVPPGIWHFQVPDFTLELITPGDFRRSLVLAGLNQQFLGTAAVVFIWTGILGRVFVEIPAAGGALSFPGRRPYLRQSASGGDCSGFGLLPGGRLFR